MLYMLEKQFNEIFSKNLVHFLKINQMTQAELAERLGVSTATTSNWCKGLKSPRMDKVDKMCNIFGCLRSDLMEDKGFLRGKKQSKGFLVNVLGRVAAGIPIEAITDIVDQEEISEDLAKTGEFFGLRIQGNSMEPDIHNGDTVIVKKQDDAETNEIVIALINGNDGVCKRLKKYAESIALVSINPDYEPMYFNQEEIDSTPVRIIGKVVELRRKL